MAAKSDDKFTVHHREKDGKHFITFKPAKSNEGYPPKEIEVTEEQWHALKFHFAMGYLGDQLIYVY